MTRHRLESSPTSVAPTVWLAAGAVAGLLVGVAIADRVPRSRRVLRGVAALLPGFTRLVGALDRNASFGALAPAVADLATSALALANGTAAWDDEEPLDDEEDLADAEDDTEADEDWNDAEFDDEALEDEDDFEDEEEDEDEEEEDGDALDARVLAAFDADPLLATLPIEIDAPAPGTIALAGVVPSARLIAHAVTIARGTPGVDRVEHTLTVRRPRRPVSDTVSGR